MRNINKDHETFKEVTETITDAPFQINGVGGVKVQITFRT